MRCHITVITALSMHNLHMVNGCLPSTRTFCLAMWPNVTSPRTGRLLAVAFGKLKCDMVAVAVAVAVALREPRTADAHELSRPWRAHRTTCKACHHTNPQSDPASAPQIIGCSGAREYAGVCRRYVELLPHAQCVPGSRA